LGENEESDVGARMLQVLADVTLERHIFILICEKLDVPVSAKSAAKPANPRFYQDLYGEDSF
jgi:hypothetical protein